VLVASSEEELQELVSRVYGAAKDAGFSLGERTTYENQSEWSYYLGSLLAQIPWSEVQC